MTDVLVEMTDSLCAKLTQMNEKIMLSVTENLNECISRSMELMMLTFQNMMTQVAKSLAECFQNALAPVVQRLDSMDTKIESKEKQLKEIIRKSNLSRGVSIDDLSSSYFIYHNLFCIYFIYHTYFILVIKPCNL